MFGNLHNMSAGQLSSAVIAGKIFDGTLTRSAFEDEFRRALGIIDIDSALGIETICRDYGCNTTTGMIVFRYWLTGLVPLVRPLVKWRGKFFLLPEFVPQSADMTVRSWREETLWVTVFSGSEEPSVGELSHSSGPARLHWCDGLVDVPVSRQLTFRMKVYDEKGSAYESFDLEPLWVWCDRSAGTAPAIGVLLDVEKLYLRTGQIAIKRTLDKVFPENRRLVQSNLPAEMGGASCLLLDRDKLRRGCKRLDVYEASRNSTANCILREQRTPREILDGLKCGEATTKRRRKNVGQQGDARG